MIHLLVSLCIVVSFVQAQTIVPGYIGKKNIAFVSGKIYALTTLNYLGDLQNTQSTYYKRVLGWEVGAQRVIGRGGMMALSISYLKDNVFSSSSAVYEKSSYSGLDFALQFRSYYYRTRGSIAPIGKHFRYNLLLSSYALNAEYQNTLIGKTVLLGFGLGLGNSRVLYDKLWVDYGWEFNYFLKVYDQQDIVGGFDYTAQVHSNSATMALITYRVNFGYLY